MPDIEIAIFLKSLETQATMVHFARDHVGFVALHAQQSWLERNHDALEVTDASWAANVTFHGAVDPLLSQQSPTLRYVNLRRNLIWPACTHLCMPARLNAIAKAMRLPPHTTTQTALHLMHHEINRFCCHPFERLLGGMYTGVWRIMAVKCYEKLAHIDSVSHEASLVIMVQPVTIVLSFLCRADLRNVCWQIDWPSNSF